MVKPGPIVHLRQQLLAKLLPAQAPTDPRPDTKPDGSAIQTLMRSSAPKPISHIHNEWVIGLAFGFRMIQWKANERMKRPLLQMKGKHMNIYMKFACIYCGQHMECKPRLCGCQILCPACDHRIVVPVHPARPTASRPVPVRDTWDTSVPMPLVEIPTRYRNRMAGNAVLAQPDQSTNITAS